MGGWRRLSSLRRQPRARSNERNRRQQN